MASSLKILFSFENPLPSREADAEVFVTTARYLSKRVAQSWFHVPVDPAEPSGRTGAQVGVPILPARAPLRPAALRHLRCGASIVDAAAFREASLVYTRNLWVAHCALRHGQRVVFDHYRPWPDQVPPLQRAIHNLMAHPRFVVNICHSDYTRAAYQRLGVAPAKLACVHNGFEPGRFRERLSSRDARRLIGIDADARTVVYTGRINHKKGLDVVIGAARRLPAIRFLLVGATGQGALEAQARAVPNIQLVPWQDEEGVGRYIQAADVLLIPPSSRPLAEFGSTVLPLKLFLYLAAARPIVAGTTPDIRELLRHDDNALLCTPDDDAALAATLDRLLADRMLARRLASAAVAASQALTWEARAGRIVEQIEQRLPASAQARAAEAAWSGEQQANWLRHSRQWLAHLARTRSWVLPPTHLDLGPELPR